MEHKQTSSGTFSTLSAKTIMLRNVVGNLFLLYTMIYHPLSTAESSFSVPIHFQINGTLTTQLLRLYPERTGSASMEEQVNQFCIQYHVIDQKCRDIYFFATSMHSKNSEEYRRVMNIPSTVVEANLSVEDVIMLRDFIGSISSFECPSQEAKTSLHQFIHTSFTAEQFHLWHHIATSDNYRYIDTLQTLGSYHYCYCFFYLLCLTLFIHHDIIYPLISSSFSSYRDLRALIPCNATAWTPQGRWYSFPVWAHNNDKHIGLVRCNNDPPDVSR